MVHRLCDIVSVLCVREQLWAGPHPCVCVCVCVCVCIFKHLWPPEHSSELRTVGV